MKIRNNIFGTIFLYLFLSPLLIASEDLLFSLKGDFLAYSYDYKQICGENVEFEFCSYRVSSRWIKIDIPSQTFYAFGDIVLKKEEEIFRGDEFLFNPQENSGTVISYKDTIEAKEIGDKKIDIPFLRNNLLDELSLSKVQESFIYFVGQLFQITNNFEVYGYDVVLYLEGFESVGFKKFKLSDGVKPRQNKISLDKIWFTKSQGIIAKTSYLYEREKKLTVLLRLAMRNILY